MASLPRVTWIAFALAAALTLPSAPLGRFGDDAAQLLAVEEADSPFRLGFHRFDLFRFIDAPVRPLAERGAAPWWSAAELKIAFWRPLSSGLMVLDRALFGRGTVGPHLHSVLWSLALVGVMALLFRRTFSPSLAGLALLLFAIDDAHALPTLWLANRNALVAGTLGFTAVLFHLRWREDAQRWAGAVSVGTFAAALLAGEAALGAVGYVVAYEWVGSDDSRRQRIRSVAPVLGVVLLWLGAYKLLGYGAAGGTLYFDPLGAPLLWLKEAVLRIPTLVGGVFAGIPADLWSVSLQLRPWLALSAVLATAVVAVLVASAWSGLDPQERRHLRWLGLGALLATVPVSATSPSSRLLVMSSVGGAAVVAVALRQAWRMRGRRLGSLAPMTAGAVLFLFHVLLVVPIWAGFHLLLRHGESRGARIQSALRESIPLEGVSGRRLVSLWSDPIGFMNTGALWTLDTGTAPRAWWVLSTSPGSLRWLRSGASTLELEPVEGRLLSSELETGFRAPELAMRVGEAVELSTGLRAEVVAADPLGITRLRFTFDVPLEDPSLVLLHWEEGLLVPLFPPPVGTTWTEHPPSVI